MFVIYPNVIPNSNQLNRASGSGKLNLIEARHPCLEVQDNVAYIPNDANFDKGEY